MQRYKIFKDLNFYSRKKNLSLMIFIRNMGDAQIILSNYIIYNCHLAFAIRILLSTWNFSRNLHTQRIFLRGFIVESIERKKLRFRTGGISTAFLTAGFIRFSSATKYPRSPCIVYTASCNQPLLATAPRRSRGYAGIVWVDKLPGYARESVRLHRLSNFIQVAPIWISIRFCLHHRVGTPVRISSGEMRIQQSSRDLPRGTRNRGEGRSRRERKQARNGWRKDSKGRERIKCRNRARNVTDVVSASVAVASPLPPLLPLLDPASPSAVHLALVSSVLQQGGSWP